MKVDDKELPEPKIKALVVEDSRLYKQMMEAVLTDLDVSAHFVGSGEACLEILEQEEFQLIYLDLHLPGIDGMEVCRQLRQQEKYQYHPIILMTEEDNEEILKQGYTIGVTDVLRKSSLENLYESVRQIIASMNRSVDGRVLFIDDSPTSAQLTMYMLDNMGLKTDHFASAELAFEDFRQQDYDIIITDIVVEGAMSGIGLVRAVRALADDRSKVPILAISGMDDAARRVEILRHGANDYIAKPIIEEEFQARVSNLIGYKKLFDQVQQQKQQLQELATTDQLTKLFNRHYLNDTAVQAIRNAHRYKHPLSLIVIDLDHFKNVNDEYGHDRGDDVLSDVGDLLKRTSRDGDIAARFGGEEFVVLFSHCSSKDAGQKAEKFRLELEAMRPGSLPVTASIGVAGLEDDMDFKALFKKADEALYAAKEGGRNYVVIADPSD